MSRKSVGGWGRSTEGPATPFGVDLGSGAAAVVAALLVASMVPAADEGWRLGIVAAVVGGFAALTGNARALAPTVVIAWLLIDGFQENRLGVLSWHGRLDLESTALLVAAGAAGLVLGAACRHVRERRSRERLDGEFRALRARYSSSVGPNPIKDGEEHGA